MLEQKIVGLKVESKEPVKFREQTKNKKDLTNPDENLPKGSVFKIVNKEMMPWRSWRNLYISSNYVEVEDKTNRKGWVNVSKLMPDVKKWNKWPLKKDMLNVIGEYHDTYDDNDRREIEEEWITLSGIEGIVLEEAFIASKPYDAETMFGMQPTALGDHPLLRAEKNLEWAYESVVDAKEYLKKIPRDDRDHKQWGGFWKESEGWNDEDSDFNLAGVDIKNWHNEVKHKKLDINKEVIDEKKNIEKLSELGEMVKERDEKYNEWKRHKSMNYLETKVEYNHTERIHGDVTGWVEKIRSNIAGLIRNNRTKKDNLELDEAEETIADRDRDVHMQKVAESEYKQKMAWKVGDYHAEKMEKIAKKSYHVVRRDQMVKWLGWG